MPVTSRYQLVLTRHRLGNLSGQGGPSGAWAHVNRIILYDIPDDKKMLGISFVVAAENMSERALRVVVGLAAGVDAFKGERWRVQLCDLATGGYPIRQHERVMSKGRPMPSAAIYTREAMEQSGTIRPPRPASDA